MTMMVNTAKAAEAIEIIFWVLIRVGQGNYVMTWRPGMGYSG